MRLHPLSPLFPDGFFIDKESVIKKFGSADNIPKFDLYNEAMFAELERGDKRYSDEEIRRYYRLVKGFCDKFGIRFNTCYIGNGIKDYYQYQDMWANKPDCFDVVGNLNSFKTTSQKVPWDTRRIHAPCKEDADENNLVEERMDAIVASRGTTLEHPIDGGVLLDP